MGMTRICSAGTGDFDRRGGVRAFCECCGDFRPEWGSGDFWPTAGPVVGEDLTLWAPLDRLGDVLGLEL